MDNNCSQVNRETRHFMDDERQITISLDVNIWSAIESLIKTEGFRKGNCDSSNLNIWIIGRLSKRPNGITPELWVAKAVEETKSNFDSLIDRERAEKEQEFCREEVKQCDQCGNSLLKQKYLIDGAIKPGGLSPWSYMCETCFPFKGAGIGWGIGQLYEKTNDGQWLLVAGFAPDEEEYEY